MWTDLKHHTKTKLRENELSLRKTGGGKNKTVYLSPIENRVIELTEMRQSVQPDDELHHFGSNAKRQAKPSNARSNASAKEDLMEPSTSSAANDHFGSSTKPQAKPSTALAKEIQFQFVDLMKPSTSSAANDSIFSTSTPLATAESDNDECISIDDYEFVIPNDEQGESSTAVTNELVIINDEQHEASTPARNEVATPNDEHYEPSTPVRNMQNVSRTSSRKLLETQISEQRKYHESMVQTLKRIKEDGEENLEINRKRLRLEEERNEMDKKSIKIKEERLSVERENVSFYKNFFETFLKNNIAATKSNQSLLEVKRMECELKKQKLDAMTNTRMP